MKRPVTTINSMKVQYRVCECRMPIGGVDVHYRQIIGLACCVGSQESCDGLRVEIWSLRSINRRLPRLISAKNGRPIQNPPLMNQQFAHARSGWQIFTLQFECTIYDRYCKLAVDPIFSKRPITTSLRMLQDSKNVSQYSSNESVFESPPTGVIGWTCGTAPYFIEYLVDLKYCLTIL